MSGPPEDGPFTIVGALGEGVYRVRARWPTDGALRLVAPALAQAGAWPAADEPQLFAHPNIVPVLATGVLAPVQVAGVELAGAYVVHAALEVPALEAALGPDPLPLESAMRHAFDLLAGLARGHTRGVVHGDLKAAKVLLDEDGVARIADYGLGRYGDAAATAGDVHAFGSIFYRMLTGRAPAAAPEPPTRHQPQLPAPLDAFVLRCLDPDPAQRFENGGTALEALSGVALAHGLPRPLEAEAAPRPERRVSWGEGLAACGGRVLASALFLGAPWLLGGLALAFPEVVRAPRALTLGWLALAAALEVRAAARAGPETAQVKLGRFAIGVFLIVIAFGAFGGYPVNLASLASPLWLVLSAAAAVIAGPACLELIREPLAGEPAAAPRVRFQGQAGTRASVDGEPDCDLPFEVDLPPGGHTVAVRQATGTVTFLLRIPASDYLVIDIPAVRLTGRFPTMAEEPPPEGGFSPAGALFSAALMLGPVLALLVGGVGLVVNPGSRVETLTWAAAKPEPEYHAPPPPPRDAQWARSLHAPTRPEQKAFDLVLAAEKKPARALDLFAQAYALVPSTRAALGAAEAAARAHDADGARAWLAKVTDEDLTNRAAVQRAAKVALDAGDVDAGLGVYAGAVQRQPADEELRAAYVVALARARRQQSAVAALLADGPTAARLARTLRLLLEQKLDPAPVLDVIERIVRDPAQRTAAMPETLLAAAEHLPPEQADAACRIVKALLATGLRHPRLRAEAQRSCR